MEKVSTRHAWELLFRENWIFHRARERSRASHKSRFQYLSLTSHRCTNCRREANYSIIHERLCDFFRFPSSLHAQIFRFTPRTILLSGRKTLIGQFRRLIEIEWKIWRAKLCETVTNSRERSLENRRMADQNNVTYLSSQCNWIESTISAQKAALDAFCVHAERGNEWAKMH